MTQAVSNSFDIETLNEMLGTQSPEQIVAWSVAEFGDGLVMSSSFGAESALLLHMATRVKPEIKVIFVDTGYLFPETHAFMESLRRRLDLNVWSYRTRHDPIEYLKHNSESDPAWRQNIENCCGVNKNEPFDRAMRELAPTAWLRGIRRDQTATRQSRQILEWSHRNNCYAVSPLLRWSQREVYQYMKRHDLPFHPLYEKGYASIGCNPLSCTRPIQIGEDPRAGRWSGQTKTECGLNVDSLDSAQL
jgi:phosphoadenosine phosphosulfate reductase